MQPYGLKIIKGRWPLDRKKRGDKRRSSHAGRSEGKKLIRAEMT